MIKEGRLKVGVTDDFLDTTEVTQTDGTKAQREAVVITDPEILAARAGVAKFAGFPDYGAVVRDAKGSEMLSLLEEIRDEIKGLRENLNSMTGYEA